jgi:uncharacterized lipoprotein YddW (UPF0748 family)
MKFYRYFFLLLFFHLFFTFSLHAQQTRALWVTRWNYSSPDDINKIITNAKNYNFNVILFQVRGAGSVCYPSNIEPWSKQFYQQDPGWDPLKLATQLAHNNGLQLHAWMNVYPAWSGKTAPVHSSQLYHSHPEWLMVDRFLRKQPLNSHYVFLSPTVPEVTDYLLNIFAEVYENYEVDGIHLDYVRYPSNSFSYDEKTLDRFERNFKSSPNEKPALWSLFRSLAITNFVSRLYQNMHNFNHKLVLSASVIGEYNKGKQVFLQDSHEWLAKGIIDVIYPMIYTRDNTHFKRVLRDHRYNDHSRYVFPGINFTGLGLIRQLEIADELGCVGSALFSYGTLFPNHSTHLINRIGLKEKWKNKTKPADFYWKELERDNVGPHVVQVQTIPVKVFSDTKFKIASKIVDASGVYDDNSGSDGQGLYLIYGKDWPFGESAEVKMSPLRNNKDWYISDDFIPPLKSGLDFRCRIFAWDDYHESANHPKRNLGYSDIWSLSVLMPTEGYMSNGYLGPILARPTIMQVDGQGKIWVADESNQLLIFNTKGEKTSYSPVTRALSGYRMDKKLGIISGMTFSPPSTMYVSVSSDSTIYRFNTLTGQPLAGIETGFAPGELDEDENGNLFVLEVGTTRWHILSPTGLELQNSPFGAKFLGSDIAVLNNAGMVFITDQSTNRVQCWRGAVEGLRSQFWRVNDLPDGDIGFGKVEVDSTNYIYVTHSQRGIITIYNQARKAVDHLTGGFPLLNAPREIAASPTSDTLYVLEETGMGPAQISSWVRKKIIKEK